MLTILNKNRTNHYHVIFSIKPSLKNIVLHYMTFTNYGKVQVMFGGPCGQHCLFNPMNLQNKMGSVNLLFNSQ